MKFPDKNKNQQKKVYPDKNKKDRSDRQIVKIAAFCFAIISWVATAKGMSEYVFHNEGWQAYTVSFAIQAILFVFNLKLPAHFGEIGRRAREEGVDPNRRKLLILIFYSMILMCSSFFSFVYIANLVYEDTRYNDSHVTLNREYREKLDDTKRYADEYTNLIRIIISEKLGNLDSELSGKSNANMRNTSTESVKSESELINDLDNAQMELEKAESTYEIAKDNTQDAQEAVRIAENALNAANTAYENATAALETAPRSNNARNNAADAYNAKIRAEDTLKASQDELDRKRRVESNAYQVLITARSNQNAAQKAKDNYERSFSASTHDMLIEILQTTPDSVKLRELLNRIHTTVVESGEIKTKLSDFANIVKLTQELTLAVDGYLTVRSVQSSMKSVSEDDDISNREGFTIESLQDQLLFETVELPNPKDEDYILKKMRLRNKTRIPLPLCRNPVIRTCSWFL